MTVQDPQLFIEAFRAAFSDADVAALLKEREFSVQFVVTGDAPRAFLLDFDGVHEGAPHPASLRLEVRPETLHLILLGQLGVTQAVVARGLVVKGPVPQVRRLADHLPAMGRAYAGLVLAPASA
ncbi:SCP2 sterol-binding domain-containing protein [Streptomyces sp. NPDC020403]|uniref:SCP2 sterol-binding domain-containing protein n=1 Tax=unclassified Streptomyces TaxID=2593676 RepID=UPI0033E6F2D5